MRNFLKIMASVLTIAAFAAANVSCSKDGDDEKDNGANNGNGVTKNNEVTVAVANDATLAGCTVKLIGYSDDKDDVTLMTTTYGSNGFELKLPASVNASLLGAPFDEVPEGLTVSNRAVKVANVYLEAYKGETYLGDFYHGVGEWSGSLLYVDGDLNVTGSFTEEGGWKYTYKLQLKKGWNTAYEKYTEKGDGGEAEYTTSVPTGAKWYFDSGK
ncbi:MAG: hypothetical protein LBK12_07055 [Odoribacteraceae bacterium]|jgi:hypothetical protein|nr:hypothetical protein [Odoribacteraceae bacterium]